jgi:hypothetical protein
VESGDCAAAISDLVVAQSLAAGTHHRVKIDLPKRSFFALRHNERTASQAENALLVFLPYSSSRPAQRQSRTFAHNRSCKTPS